MKALVPMFDWNGNLAEDLKEDEKTFNVKITMQEEEVLGNALYEIEGQEECVRSFLAHYELETAEG